MILSWSARLAVGHADIDEQHRELIRHFNELLEACRRGEGKRKVVELVGFLETYVVGHFAAEERLMAASDYPERAEHCARHAELTGRLADLRAALDNSGASFDLVIDANQVLFNWIVEHIRKADVRLGAYLRTCAETC